MKRDTKRILIVGLFAILAVSFFISVAAAQNNFSLGTGFSDFFSKWTEGTMGVNMAKVMFFIMIALIIYVILDGVFPGYPMISLILGGVVSFLSTAYLAPADIFSLLNSYTALGLTLSALVPLLILGALTYRAASNGNVQLSMMAHFGWILFAVFSGYRYILDTWWVQEGSGAMNMILLVTAVVATGISIFYGTVRNMIAKEYIKTETDAAAKLVMEAWDLRAAEVKGAKHALGSK